MAKILLVFANGFMDNLIPVGISLLSACLKKENHTVDLFDTTFYRTRDRTGDEARAETLQVKETNLEDLGLHEKKSDLIDDFIQVVTRVNPDLIAFSVLESTYYIALELIRGIKNYDIPIIIGGVYVSMAPEDVIKEEGVDIICVGEGEEALVELASRMDDKEDYSDILNLWVKRNGKIIKNPLRPLVDLNTLPMLDWSLYEKERFYKPMGGKIWICAPIEIARGCPHRCSFCCNAGLQDLYKGTGYFPREKGIEKFIEEVKIKSREYNLQYLYIVGENFLQMNDEKFSTFTELYKEIGLPFWFETRPETITLERIKELRKIRCEGISVGVEHGNEQFRRTVLNRFVSNEKMIESFRIARDSGIRISANNIVGFPTETRELFFDTVELNRKLQAEYLMMSIFSPYKGTKLRLLCEEKGYIPKSVTAGDYRLDVSLDMPQLNRDAIKGLQRTFALYVRFPREMWPEIEKAEKFDDRGNATFERLGNLYKQKYL
ncbi:MAG: B12-binding domain-containing radical SAM protein [Theionarchaea archaeon]|nr:B12-binding domain-containing radical SAM protein [Theionarchaea archaeon]